MVNRVFLKTIEPLQFEDLLLPQYDDVLEIYLPPVVLGLARLPQLDVIACMEERPLALRIDLRGVPIGSAFLREALFQQKAYLQALVNYIQDKAMKPVYPDLTSEVLRSVFNGSKVSTVPAGGRSVDEGGASSTDPEEA